MRTVAIVVLAIVAAIPAHAGFTSGGAFADSAGNVFTVSPQGNILGFNGQAAAVVRYH